MVPRVVQLCAINFHGPIIPYKRISSKHKAHDMQASHCTLSWGSALHGFRIASIEWMFLASRARLLAPKHRVPTRFSDERSQGRQMRMHMVVSVRLISLQLLLLLHCCTVQGSLR